MSNKQILSSINLLNILIHTHEGVAAVTVAEKVQNKMRFRLLFKAGRIVIAVLYRQGHLYQSNIL